MGLSLFGTTGRAKKGQKFVSLPCRTVHSCRRSGRSPALPYPPHEYYYSITSGGGLIFNVKKGSISMLIFWYN